MSFNTDPHVVEPGPGVTRVTWDEGQRALQLTHDALAAEVCEFAHPWDECQTFALARIRSVGQTAYVLMMRLDGSGRYSVYTFTEGGPYVWCDIEGPYDTYGLALKRVYDEAMAQPETNEV